MNQTQNNYIQNFTKENIEFFRNYFFARNISFVPVSGYTNGDYQLLIANNIYYLFNSTANTVALVIDGVNEDKAVSLANLYLSDQKQ